MTTQALKGEGRAGRELVLEVHIYKLRNDGFRSDYDGQADKHRNHVILRYTGLLEHIVQYNTAA